MLGSDAQDVAGVAEEWRYLQEAQDFIASLFAHGDGDLVLPGQRGYQGRGAPRATAS